MPSAAAQSPSPQSWDASFDAAACGDVILLPAGSYPAQSFSGDKACDGNPVVFRADGQVIAEGLSFNGADHVTVEGVELTYKGTDPGAGNQRGVWVGPGSVGVTLVNIDAGSVSSWMADQLTVQGGDYGPCDAVTGNNVCGNNKQDFSRNVLIEGAYFHDLEYDPSAPGAHWECMYVNGGENVTIRNNRFERCAIFDLFVTISGPDAGGFGHENLTVEGNRFEPATDGNGNPSRGWSSLSLSWCQNAAQPSYRNVTIRGNSFGEFAGIERDLNADGAGCVWENVLVEGNTLAWAGGCQNGWAYQNNRWFPSPNGGNGTCGPGDVMIASSEGPPPPPPPDEPPLAAQCYDGLDNDTDGLVDADDPDCNDEAASPPAYDPACAPDCDAMIADLELQVAAHTAERDQALVQRDELQAKIDRVRAARQSYQDARAGLKAALEGLG